MNSNMEVSGSPPVLVGDTSLANIRMLAQNNSDLVFTSLAHRIDLSLLRDSFRVVRRSEAAGVDGMTAREYAEQFKKLKKEGKRIS